MGDLAHRTIDGSAPVPRDPRTPASDDLRVAMIAPPWFELPPTGYGGIESVVADLVDALSAAGHDVTLIGAGRHRTRASRFVAAFDRPPSDRLGTPELEVLHAARAAAALRAADVDIVHDHTLAGPLLALRRSIPTVVTMHGPVAGELGDYYAALGDAVYMVAISDAQLQARPDLNWVGTVHNAIDVASFPFRARKDGFVLWLGRFNPDKGAHLAIDAARAAGLPILLAGKCSEPAEQAYFSAEIAPRLGDGVTHVGEADGARKRELFAAARALVFPIQWEEPFGMVMIEALACGTPVVALRRGSVPEVIRHGYTGLIVDDPAQLAGALHAVTALDPTACRAEAEARFSLPVMADAYERVYRDVLQRHRTNARMAAPKPTTKSVA